MHFVLTLTLLAAGVREVPLFDALSGYVKAPDLTQQGLRHIEGPGKLWESKAAWEEAEKAPELPKSVEARVRNIARQMGKVGAPLMYLDIEWRMADDSPHAAANRRKFMRIADIFHEEAPGMRIGFYGELPVGDYWRTIEEPDSAKYQSWHAENVRMLELSKHVDVVFPSLYTFYDNQEGWVKHAKAVLKEARMYNKPVYAFLWPEYHNSNRLLAGQDLTGRFWDVELTTVAALADGIVIWGWGANRKEWNPEAPWWKATIAFLTRSRTQSR